MSTIKAFVLVLITVLSTPLTSALVGDINGDDHIDVFNLVILGQRWERTS